MPRRKPPSWAVKRVCPICGYVTGELTEKEWHADRAIHEKSELHQQALQRVAELLATTVTTDPKNRRELP